MNKDREIPDFKPVNSEERIMYGMLIRLDALCDMVESLVEHIAKEEDIPVTNETYEEVQVEEEEEETKQCEGITASGNRCKRTAQEGSNFCRVHDKE